MERSLPIIPILKKAFSFNSKSIDIIQFWIVQGENIWQKTGIKKISWKSLRRQVCWCRWWRRDVDQILEMLRILPSINLHRRHHYHFVELMHMQFFFFNSLQKGNSIKDPSLWWIWQALFAAALAFPFRLQPNRIQGDVSSVGSYHSTS